MRFYSKCVVLSIIIIFSSCKALKIRDVEERKTLSYSNAVMFKLRNSERPEHLLIQNGNLKIQNENTTNLKLTVYSEKDKLIFLSGRYLGFEIFRLMLTKDSIKFINRAQQSYFFGSKNNMENELLRSVSLKDIQDLMFTGFMEQTNMDRRYVERNFEPKVDKIFYNKVLDEGIKIEMEYDLAAFLTKMLLSNHIDSVYIDMFLKRNDTDLESITGSYYRNNYEIKFEFETNEIKNSSYSRTKFNIGKNYNEIRNIL